MGKKIELKVWPESFRDLKMGRKTFEFRKDDRDYQIGDTLVLKEWKKRKKESLASIQTKVKL